MGAKRGAGFEARLIEQCDTARRDRLAVVWKTNPPTVGEPGSMSYSGVGPPDFTGFMCSGGPGIAFDAKEVARERILPLRRIEPHQGTDLEATWAADGYAFLAVDFLRKGGGPRFFRWDDIRQRYWAWRLHGTLPASLDMDEGVPFTHWLEACK